MPLLDLRREGSPVIPDGAGPIQILASGHVGRYLRLSFIGALLQAGRVLILSRKGASRGTVVGAGEIGKIRDGVVIGKVRLTGHVGGIRRKGKSQGNIVGP